MINMRVRKEFIEPNQINGVYVQRISKIIFDMGYCIDVIDDFEELQWFLRSQGAYENPSFDPNFHDMNKSAFWIKITNKNKSILASHAERIFYCDDFCRYVLDTDKIWFSGGVQLERSKWRTELNRTERIISGKIAFAGGMFVREEARGKKLSLFLTHLSRALFIDVFDPDWFTGLVRENIAKTDIPMKYYGFPRTSHLFFGTIPRTKGDFKDLHLCWMDKGEGILSIENLLNHQFTNSKN
jgi:hypothetical protein